MLSAFLVEEWKYLADDEEEYTKMVEGYKKMIKTGIPVTDWGVVKKDGKTYYIMYVL